MAAAMVEMAAAIFIQLPVTKQATAGYPESTNKDDAGNPVTIFPPGGPNQFPPLMKLRMHPHQPNYGNLRKSIGATFLEEKYFRLSNLCGFRTIGLPYPTDITNRCQI